MAKLKVNVSLLNTRSHPVVDTSDKTNVTGRVKAGFTFESVDQRLLNAVTWYKDWDGNWYWGGGLVIDSGVAVVAFSESEPAPAPSPAPVTNVVAQEKWVFDAAKMSWAFSGPNGLDLIELWNRDLMGQKVRVAILDSGINTAITDITDSIKDKSKDMKSFVPGEDISDLIGHGTACASVLASSGKEVFGSAPECDLIIGKIRSKSVSLDYNSLLDALKWACEERKADIVSMSFSATYDCGKGLNENWKQVADYIDTTFRNHSILFLAAIGNTGPDEKDRCVFPANLTNVLSIGAFDAQKSVCELSSWNKNLNMVAPGEGLFGYGSDGQKKVLKAATSYACPFMAGVLANLVGYCKQKGIAFSASALIGKIAYDQPLASNPLNTGKGIININQTLENLQS